MPRVQRPEITYSRIAMWIAQILGSGLVVVLWFMFNEVRIKVGTLEGILHERSTAVAELKLKVATTDEVVKEIRVEMKQINATLQDIRLAQQAQQHNRGNR